MEYINAKFVSQKISKTRWRPVSSASLQKPDIFATGSWDNEDNKVSIWSVGELSVTSMEDEFEGDPQLLCDYRHGGDVMDLQFLDHERIVTASSTGAVTIFRHHHNSQVDLSFQCFLSEFRPHSVLFFQFKTFFFWFCCLSDCVSVLLLLFSSLRFSGNVHIPKNIILSLIVVKTLFQNVRIGSSGSQDGVLCIWDVRQGSMPFALMEAHSAEMWEVHFHPSNPDHLFTCSEDGSLWHWENSTGTDTPSFLQGGRNTTITSRSTVAPHSINQSLISSWLSSDSSKGRLETTNMLPGETMSVNSLDVLGQHLVCGTDGEAIYVSRHVPV
nr:PREDICTED: nucleoporin Nup43 [Lepisosteus oculatus]